MKFLIFKYLLTSALVVTVSEAARSGHRWAALLAALPFVATIALAWMKAEGATENRMAEFAVDTFWYVLPTVPMFLIFGLLVTRIGFALAMLCSIIITLGLFYLLALLLAQKGHPLL